MKKNSFHIATPLTNISSKGNVLLFKAISILLPLTILILLEVSLRIFHYGNNLNLFIEYSGNKDFLVFNPQASKKYFTDPTFATNGNTELFKKKKDVKTVRIFVLGESTTIGYPYFYTGSFHRWLQYRLMNSSPAKNFEIINLSLTAVNSYTIRGFAKELVDYEPDAVLMYVGHNEYYGAMGVGSTQSIGGNPTVVNLILELRRLRVTQLMTSTYQKAIGLFVHKSVDLDATRMGLMVANQQIGYQSNLYKKGIDQFRSNIDETLHLFQKHNIPVFISNLVSNEKDLPPFVSIPADQSQAAAFTAKYDQGLNALAKNDSLSALNCFRIADQLFPGHARCNYYLGQSTFHQGDYSSAKEYFAKARDLDALRFRAPQALNEVIVNLCKQYPNAHLVDTKAKFEDNSDKRIIGDNLIIDHVHPNLKGYSLMSDAFYEAMKSAHIFPISSKKEMTYEQLVKEMPITKVDSLVGVFRIHNLKGRWPFNDPHYKNELPVRTEEEKIARELALKQINWQTANDNLYAYYVGNNQLKEAGKITEALVLEHPKDQAFYEKAAMLCGELKNYEKAVFYFKKSFELSPSFEKAKYLFVIYLKMDQPTAAIPFLDYAIANNTRGLKLSPIKISAEKIIRLQEKFAADSTNLTVQKQIAGAYLTMDNQEGASKYLHRIIKADSKNKEAQELLKQLNQINKNGQQ